MTPASQRSRILTVIPTRNSLEATVVSVKSWLAQTMLSRCLIVDNKSEDGSLEALQSLFRGVQDLEIVQNSENLGRVGNWNRAIDLASERGASHIRFLFAGEELKPICIEKCERVLESFPGVAAIGHDYVLRLSGKEYTSRMPLEGFLSPERVTHLNHVQGGFLGSIVANVYSMECIGAKRFNEIFVGKSDFDYRVLKGQSAYYIPETLSISNAIYRGTFHQSLSFWMACEDAYVRTSSLRGIGEILSEEEIHESTARTFFKLLNDSVQYLPFRIVVLGFLKYVSVSSVRLMKFIFRISLRRNQ